MKHNMNVNVNKNAKQRNNVKQEGTKQPFDKKKYRLKKYSNKYKIDQWEERRKKAVLRDYYKQVHKDENTKKAQQKSIDPNSSISCEDDKRNNQAKFKKNAFYAAKQKFLQKKNEKKGKKEEYLRAKLEREDALTKYKQKKMETYKKLSKKTKKGQPVMKDRLEMLLEKIEQSSSS